MFNLKTLRSTIAAVSLGLASVLAVGTANAAPITGQLDLAGLATFTRDGSGTITEIDFANPVTVLQATGSLSLGGFTSVTFSPDPWDVSAEPLPINDLWVTNNGTFSFDLTSIAEIDNETVSGMGIMSSTIAGLDETIYSFNLTTQDNGLTTNVSFSVTQVPEPSAAALLGLGLVGLAIGRRRARK